MVVLKLTDPDGQHVWINARYITKIRQPLPGRHSPKANTIVSMANIEQAVQEPIEEVLRMLEDAGPNV